MSENDIVYTFFQQARFAQLIAQQIANQEFEFKPCPSQISMNQFSELTELV